MPPYNKLEAGLSNIKSNILGFTLAVISSIALFCYVIFIFQDEVRFSVATELGVTTGHPVWKVFQSRVLGPYIVKALSFGFFQNYGTAHAEFQIATVAIAAFLCWRLGRKYGGDDQSALRALTLFVMCFLLLLTRPYHLYSWDLIDIIVFIVFINFALSGLSLPWFLGLFAIAIWNRDSANFIALWLILDPFVRFFYQRHKLPKTPLDWHRILGGAICIGTGLIIVELLKQNLLIEKMDVGNTYNITLTYNIDFLRHPLVIEFWIVVPFLATVTSLGAKFARLDPQRHLSIYLIELSLLASLFLFGFFPETRIFLILIPFVVISGVLVSGSATLVAVDRVDRGEQ